MPGSSPAAGPLQTHSPLLAVHTAEDVLSWCSISILCVFTVELLAKLLVFGHTYFTKSKCAPAAAC
jgi:hypothetical protein